MMKFLKRVAIAYFSFLAFFAITVFLMIKSSDVPVHIAGSTIRFLLTVLVPFSLMAAIGTGKKDKERSRSVIQRKIGFGNATSEKCVGNLAYDVCGKENLIYVLEDNRYVPYIVVTNNYDDKTLLLRKNILNYFTRFSNEAPEYKLGIIDEYLCNTHSESVKNVSLVSAATHDPSDDDECVSHSFLLSAKELGFSNYKMKRGGDDEALKYFKDNPDRVAATDEMDQKRSYWTRTPDKENNSAAFAVSDEGKLISSGIFDNHYLRPAFCIDGETGYAVSSNIIVGESVFVIDCPCAEEDYKETPV